MEAQAMGVKCFVSDSVPRSTDCGGCIYLPLSDGPEKWADAIVEDFRRMHGMHGSYDCNRFTEENVMKEYRIIYGG